MFPEEEASRCLGVDKEGFTEQVTFKLICGLSGQEGEGGHSRQSKVHEPKQGSIKEQQIAQWGWSIVVVREDQAETGMNKFVSKAKEFRL